MLHWPMGVLERNLYVYVHGTALPHTACDTKAFLAQRDGEIMELPALSPDMDPIEHFRTKWGYGS